MDKLAELQTKAKEIATRIEAHRQLFTRNGNKWEKPEQRSAWENDNDAYDVLHREIQQLRAVADAHTRGMRIKKGRSKGSTLPSNALPGQYTPDELRDVGGDREVSKPTGRHRFRTNDGRTIRSYAPKDLLVPRDRRVNIGRCLRAILLNRTQDLRMPEERAILGAVDSSGGYLLTPALSLNIVDLARASSVAIRAGAQTIKMNTAELCMGRITSDPTTQWRPELGSITASQPAFDKIVLKPKTVAAIIPVSLEAMEDIENLGEILNASLRGALGLALDLAVLSGTGAAGQPKGIRNHADVNTVATVGTPTDYSKFSQAVGEILTDNFPGDPSELAWILHPRDGIILDKLEDSTGQPLQMTPWVSKLQRFSTTGLSITEGAGAESVSIIGDFSQVVIGMRSDGVQINVLSAGQVTDATGATINAASQLARFVVAHMRVDVALVRPTWLCNLTGITIT